MILDIAALTASASRWDVVSEVSATVVFFAVLTESVADFDTLARWTRLASRPEWRDRVARIGLLFLIIALAVEVVAAIASHEINTEVVAVLNTELDTTVKHEIELTKLTKSLVRSNEALEREAKALRKEADDQLDLIWKSSRLEDAAATREADLALTLAAQKGRADKALAALASQDLALKDAQKTATNAYKRSRPRRMLSCDTWEPLRTQPPRPIEILYSKGAPDAFLFGMEIGLCLDGVGWKMGFPKPIKVETRRIQDLDNEVAVEESGGSPGGASITVAVNSKGRTMTTFVEGTPEAAVAKALSDVFGDAVATNVREDIPEGTIRIVIGPK